MKSEGTPPIKIRKAKQNWLEGKKETAVRFQVQQRFEDARRTPKINNAIPEIRAMFEAVIQASETKDSEINEQLLHSAMAKTKKIIDEKILHIPSIASWLTLLLNDCRAGHQDDLSRYLNLVNKLSTVNHQIIRQWIMVHTALAENEKIEHSGLLFDVQDGLEKHSTLLNSIVELYGYKPYPNIEQFVAALGKERKKLKAYIETFDRDPWERRSPQYTAEGRIIQSTEQILKQQFDTSQVQRVIAKMRNSVNREYLTTELQYELAQQVTYINAIGKDHPLMVKNKTYTDLTKLSRLELRELSKVLTVQIRTPIFGENTKLSRLKAQLNLLAVMREQYFRITGQFIDSTQILSVLVSLNNQQHNILIEIEPEEKRKLVTLLCAAMQWVNADGGSVDVCIPYREAVAKDYGELGAKLFFTAMNIPSATVEADDPAGTYQVDGINYTTIADLALYRSRAQKEKEVLTADDRNREPSSNVIISGLDGSSLNNRTLFDLLASANQSKVHQLNPYVWIYPLINEFINQKEFRNRDTLSDEVWDEELDVIYLKLFLENHAKTSIHKQQLEELSDTALSSWINLACKVQQLVEGEDFIVDATEQSASVAVPVYLKKQQQSFFFSHEIQHFLYARLQKKYPSLQFLITAEKEVIDSVSSKELFDFYKQNGRIMAIFGKSTMKQELAKQNNELNIEVAIRVPSHEQYQREELDCHHLPINEPLLQKIKSIIAQAQSGQPIVLLVQDAYQVEKLFQELSQQFAKDGKAVQLGAFTGDECEETRTDWIANHAGQPNTITIATSLLTKGHFFNTDHYCGFLGIHTYSEAPNKTRKFIEQIVPKNRPGCYVVLYEEERVMCSSSWSYQAEQGKDSTIDIIAKIHRKKSQEIAIERYYTQAVADIQLVVLQQIDEWQALLHLLYPKNEWKRLDSELFVFREELRTLLEEEWTKCLASSDPDKVYFNPYIRRDRKGKLQTSILNKTLKEYEQAVATIWKTKCDVLKGKTVGKTQKGSVNELRCHYLERVSLEEQLKAKQLADRQKRKAIFSAKKKMSRAGDFGLDVNGAMLAYSDASKERYKLVFAKNQIQFLVAEIAQVIDSSSLSSASKSMLNERLKGIDSFLAIASFLNNYFSLFDFDNLAERYLMQPMINELLRVYDYSSLQLTEIHDLEELKNTYINNVAFDVAYSLEQNLSWALEENRGWGLEYWLERTAVKTAAQDLLVAVDAVKNAIDTATRKQAIKDLYKLLAHHQAELEDLWIFSFGHRNTRDVINQTLKTLDTLTVIGSGYEQLDVTFIQDCKEEAYSRVMKAQFNTVIEQLESQNNWLQDNPRWNHIRQQLHVIQSDNKTVYAIDDLYYLLSKISKELNLSGLPSDASLFKLVIELRGALRSIWDKFAQNHKEMINESKHLKIKAEQLRENLHALSDYTVENVTINHGQNGFHEFFDLIIEGTGSCPLFDSFLIYNSQLSELDKEQEGFVNRGMQINEWISALQKLQTEQLPQFRSDPNKPLDKELFPPNCHEQIGQLHRLKNFLADVASGDLSDFSQEEQDLFHDKELVKMLDITQLNLEQIAQFKSEKIKAEFLILYNKINELASQKEQNFFSKVLSFLASPFSSRETSEDLAYQFSIVRTMPSDQLRSMLQSRVNALIDTLSTQLNAHERAARSVNSLLGGKINFLQQQINEEKRKSRVIIKRFTNLDQLYDFEIELRSYKAIHSVPSVPSTPSTEENPMSSPTAANEEHAIEREEPTMSGILRV
ncbi:hypothetical protein [Legionella fallonii]|uniref:LigA, interaptin n=1 Tax=Legionella fallonii LLAP-10 TaxID=1212491 RepID=A0A098G3E1_9GAMM|nr:hypothetical protein [Legionella fallonii]CEG56005.1 conserved protein of unknown function [Legionella fallonii LLAP-10]